MKLTNKYFEIDINVKPDVRILSIFGSNQYNGIIDHEHGRSFSSKVNRAMYVAYLTDLIVYKAQFMSAINEGKRTNIQLVRQLKIPAGFDTSVLIPIANSKQDGVEPYLMKVHLAKDYTANVKLLNQVTLEEIPEEFRAKDKKFFLNDEGLKFVSRVLEMNYDLMPTDGIFPNNSTTQSPSVFLMMEQVNDHDVTLRAMNGKEDVDDLYFVIAALVNFQVQNKDWTVLYPKIGEMPFSNLRTIFANKSDVNSTGDERSKAESMHKDSR